MMKLDKRQKFIFGLVVIAIVILVWQMVSLFGGESSPLSTKPKVQTITSLKETGSPTQVMQPARQTAQPTAQTEKSSSPEINENQQQYLALVNEYQLVEIQRLIAQDQAAIASARASMAESLSKMNQAGAGNAGGAGALASSIAAANNQPGDYELIYTGQDNGEWSATLKRNGQFNDVTAGSVLPDGDKVLSVDDNGVLIQQGDVKKLVTFNGVTVVNNKPADQYTAPEAAGLQSQFQTPVQTPAPAAKSAIKKESKSTQTTTQTTTKVTTQDTGPSPVVPAEKPLVLPKVVATNALPVVPNVNTRFDITNTNKRYYTIQLVSEADFDAVKAFVAQNGLKNKAQVVKVWRNEKPWYIAVMGEYSNSAAANRAIQKLPLAVCDEGPFARRIQDVRSEMVK